MKIRHFLWMHFYSKVAGTSRYQANSAAEPQEVSHLYNFQAKQHRFGNQPSGLHSMSHPQQQSDLGESSVLSVVVVQW